MKRPMHFLLSTLGLISAAGSSSPNIDHLIRPKMLLRDTNRHKQHAGPKTEMCGVFRACPISRPTSSGSVGRGRPFFLTATVVD